jgi:HSP20 family molecular chaperone IbpA
MDFEVFEDSGIWRLTADIPGVEEHEVCLARGDGDLVIETKGVRRFRCVSPLPEGIGPDDLEMSLRNGILELTAAVAGSADR